MKLLRRFQFFKKSSVISQSAQSLKKDDFVHGAMLLVHHRDLIKLTIEDLQLLVNDWRGVHTIPEEIKSRKQAMQHWGPEITSADLRGVDLSDMDLRCVKLLHCNLRGADISNANLDGAHFFGCDLSQVESWNLSFRFGTMRQCSIVSSRFMYAHIEGADFAHSNIENTKLIHSYNDSETWYLQTRLYRTNLRESHLEKVDLSEARTLFGVHLYQARLEGTIIDYDLFEGRIGEELEREYAMAAKSYMAIKANLDARGYYAEASKAYVKERQMEKAASAPWNSRRCYGVAQLGDKYEYSSEYKRHVRTRIGTTWSSPQQWIFYINHTTKWITDWTVELLCNYGESIWRVLGWIVAMIFLIGPILLQATGGLYLTGSNQETYNMLSSPLQKRFYSYLQYVMYMIDTFTTANFAEMKPTNDFVRLLSGLMAFVGIFLAGLLGFVTGNRIRHS